MNFDRLAPFYPWMESLLAGSLMHRSRTTHLDHVQDRRRALLVGEGTGKFLADLLRSNARIEVTCVEHSANMIQQARRRLADNGLAATRVEFQQRDILHWSPPLESFDLVVTHFFLDCFKACQLERLLAQLAAGATPDAVWLIADFSLPEGWLRRWRARIILRLLYLFFRLTTGVYASRLVPPDDFLRTHEFSLVRRELASFGLVRSDLWQRGAGLPALARSHV